MQSNTIKSTLILKEISTSKKKIYLRKYLKSIATTLLIIFVSFFSVVGQVPIDYTDETGTDDETCGISNLTISSVVCEEIIAAYTVTFTWEGSDETVTINGGPGANPSSGTASAADGSIRFTYPNTNTEGFNITLTDSDNVCSFNSSYGGNPPECIPPVTCSPPQIAVEDNYCTGRSIENNRAEFYVFDDPGNGCCIMISTDGVEFVPLSGSDDFPDYNTTESITLYA